ncbi:hypothetical protein M4J38_05425 [Parasegetibacter sp. NRK P23]|nr:hypothetical protein [Parasegetibacter sp. NRK P23]
MKKTVKLNSFASSLTRSEMKTIKGGDGLTPGRDEDFGCMGCTADWECQQVNKGKCTKQCKNGNTGCSAW